MQAVQRLLYYDESCFYLQDHSDNMNHLIHNTKLQGMPLILILSFSNNCTCFLFEYSLDPILFWIGKQYFIQALLSFNHFLGNIDIHRWLKIHPYLELTHQNPHQGHPNFYPQDHHCFTYIVMHLLDPPQCYHLGRWVMNYSIHWYLVERVLFNVHL